MTTPAEFGRIPDFQLHFAVQRHIAEGGAFHADVAPLAVRAATARSRSGRRGRCRREHRMAELAGDGVGLGDLLRLQPLALEHVQEVGVAAEVELVGAVEPHAAVAEEVGEHAVGDGGADLAT